MYNWTHAEQPQGSNAQRTLMLAAQCSRPAALELSAEQLRAFDGTNPAGRVFVSVRGTIYDVSDKGRDFYGPGASVAAISSPVPANADANIHTLSQPKDGWTLPTASCHCMLEQSKLTMCRMRRSRTRFAPAVWQRTWSHPSTSSCCIMVQQSGLVGLTLVHPYRRWVPHLRRARSGAGPGAHVIESGGLQRRPDGPER